LFLTTNLPWQLDDYDQAKPAFSSFEMVHEGHWLYQRTPLDLVAQKPPFFGWVSTICYGVTRWWDIAWRLPSLISALAISILLLRAASLAYGRTAGLISFGAFGFNLLSARLATLVTTDMLLALSIFNRLAYLAENSQRQRLELTRSMVVLWFVNHFTVYKRPDRVCFFASGNRGFRLAEALG